MENLKILKLQAENFKRLVAVEITPSGSVVKLTGKNKQGKSSILDAVWAALAGMDAVPGVPIRKGQEKASIRLDMGEVVVTRTFGRPKAKEGELIGPDDFTTSIKVENADGFKAGKPQQVLDALISSRAADPIRFARLPAKEQFDIMRKFVPGVDFAVLKAEHDIDFAARRDVNRDADREAAAAASITVPEGTPEEPVDEQALVDELAAAGEKSAAIENERRNREHRKTLIATRDTDWQRATDQAAKIIADAKRQCEEIMQAATTRQEEQLTLANQHKAAKERLEEAQRADTPLETPPDTAAIRERLTAAKSVNAAVADKKRKAAHASTAGELLAKSKALTEKMEAREAAKQAKIAEGKLPVEGLEFGDGVLIYNGVPFDQASYRERLVVSCALEMAANPPLRILRIEHGNDLDTEGLAIIADLAAKNNFQVWVEAIDESGKVGFVIEDGAVKTVNE